MEAAFLAAGAESASSFLTNGTLVFSARSSAKAAKIHAGGVIPAKISREAMEEHFDTEKGLDALKRAYAQDAEMINARAADFIIAGVSYTRDSPLVLKTEDF